MPFHIIGLAPAPFAPLFELDELALREHRAVRLTADGPGFPCRVGLRDARAGEQLLLINFEHQSAHSPYRSSHAIYVAKNSTEVELGVGEVPAMLSTRMLSVRAFDATGFMIGAEVCEGRDGQQLFEAMLDNAHVSYLHAHTARRGCYLAKVERVTD
jgi:hypothetical protein